MEIYDFSRVNEYNKFLFNPKTDEVVLVVGSNEPSDDIMEFARYSEEANPGCEVIVTLWEDAFLFKHEDTVYLRHKDESDVYKQYEYMLDIIYPRGYRRYCVKTEEDAEAVCDYANAHNLECHYWLKTRECGKETLTASEIIAKIVERKEK